MEKAGRQTAMYSVPPSPGVEYCAHSPRCAMTAWPVSSALITRKKYTALTPTSLSH